MIAMRGRFLLVRGITLLIFFALLLRLHALQLGANATLARQEIENVVQQIDYIAPRRGEIFASNGTTLLAASLPTSVVGIQVERLPRDPLERAAVYMRLSSLLPFTDTLSISPTSALRDDPALAAAVAALVPILPADTVIAPGYAVTLTVPVSQSMAALEIGTVFSDVVTLHPGAAQLVREANLPPYLAVPVATDIPREIALALSENAAILPGVRVLDSFRRAYPLSDELPSLSHWLGYVNRVTAEDLAAISSATGTLPTYLDNDIIGRDGLEATYEQQLRGALGINQIDVDVFQRTIGEPKVIRSVVDGSNLILNVDSDLQRASEMILRKWFDIADQRRIALASLNSAVGRKVSGYKPITNGVIAVMDVKTGAVLAMVSLPSYNDNMFVQPTPDSEFTALFSDERAPLINRALYGFPPGSTFKQFTGAAALRNGVISPDTHLRDPGKLIVRNKYFENLFDVYPNSNSNAYGLINISDALMVSSNVFFQSIAGGTDFVTNLNPGDPQIENGIGIERLHQMLVGDYGFSTLTGVDLPGESSGLIPDPEWKRKVERKIVWSVGDTYLTAIGQGDVKVSPLQLLVGTIATATSGTIYRPQMVHAITTLDRSITTTIDPVIERQIDLDPAYWSIIREGMRRSVQDPAAYNRRANAANRPAGNILADIDRFNLAGKTGTAEYAENNILRSHSWFVGFAPFDDPQVAVVALLEGTGDLGDGSGTLALPAVVDVLRAYYHEPFPDASGTMPPPPASLPEPGQR